MLVLKLTFGRFQELTFQSFLSEVWDGFGWSWMTQRYPWPIPGSFFENWVERLCVLVEVRPELRDRASLASIILGIETLPSEPALLKSHLNRLHTQRHPGEEGNLGFGDRIYHDIP